MTEGKIEERVLQFAFPILLSNLLQQLYNTIDAIVVGRYVGSVALAAVGSTGALINLIIGFFIGLSTGAGVVVAQVYGARDKDGIHKSVHTAIAISIACAVVIAVVGITCTPFFLRLMGTPEDVMEPATIYLRIVLGGVFFLTVYNMGSGILRAVGDSTRPLIYLAVCALLNVGLNLIFVLVFDMGVAGVGWATVIAQSVSMVLVLRNLMQTQEEFRLYLSKIKFHKEVFMKIVRIGLPAGIQSMVISFSNVVVQSHVNSFGAVAMAGFTASGKIDTFIYMTMNSIGLTATTFVGQNIGAQNYQRVREGTKHMVALCVGITIAVAIPITIFAPQLVSIINSEPEVVVIGTFQLRVLAVTYFLLAIPEVLVGVIRGAGRSLAPMVMSLTNMCVIRILWLTLLMPIFDSIWVISACYPFSWLLNAIMYLIYIKKSDWLSRYEKTNVAE